MNDSPQKRRRFDDAFKRQAVQTLMESGKPVTAVAAILGVDRTNLQKWKKYYSSEVLPKPAGTDETPVGISEFLSLKREFESIKESVTQLRTIVRKSLTEKY
jgi:transposase-like protein